MSRPGAEKWSALCNLLSGFMVGVTGLSSVGRTGGAAFVPEASWHVKRTLNCVMRAAVIQSPKAELFDRESRRCRFIHSSGVYAFLIFFNTSTVNYPKTNTVDLREIVHLAPLVYSTFRMFEKGWEQGAEPKLGWCRRPLWRRERTFGWRHTIHSRKRCSSEICMSRDLNVSVDLLVHRR